MLEYFCILSFLLQAYEKGFLEQSQMIYRCGHDHPGAILIIEALSGFQDFSPRVEYASVSAATSVKASNIQHFALFHP